MLQITHLTAGYDDLQILKKVSLKLERDTISILMGPNGAGKSTLLKSIFNLTDITDGKIEFEEKDITGLAAHKLLGLGIAFVPQGRNNFGLLNVRDNLLMGALNKREKGIEKKLAMVFDQFPDLKKRQKQLAYTLSGGQQQMLAIARALISSPKLLLLDEPSLGLSPKLVKELFQEIKKIRENFSATILIVEHNLKSLMNIADYGFVLVQGEIVAQDRCSSLKNNEIMRKVFVGEFD